MRKTTSCCFNWSSVEQPGSFPYSIMFSILFLFLISLSGNLNAQVQCISPSDCDDNDVCTIDICTQAGECVYRHHCDDDQPCTEDQCDINSGILVCTNTAKDCDDGNPCTADACDAQTGECTNIYGCSLDPSCCDDGNPCTADACNTITNQCSNTYDCTLDPSCCDDGNPCTIDKCHRGICRSKDAIKLEFDYDHSLCAGQSVQIENESEGVDSNATYYLDIGSDGTIDGSISASSLPVDSTLVIPLTGDIDFTVIVVNPDGCSDTLSASITILDCDDGDPCTVDECDDEECEHSPLCIDGDPCTADSCINGQCIFTPLCDDGDPCTVDQCILGTGHYSDGNHDDDDDGNSDDDDGENDDDDGGDDDDDGVSYTCIFTSVCDDGDACTYDTCDSLGQCINTTISCDDSDPCTEDACEDGVCVHLGPSLSFDFNSPVCLGNEFHATNNSTGIDSNATYYLDLGSDGTIDLSVSASDLPADSSAVAPFAGSIDFTIVVVNADGCSDTLSSNLTIVDCDDGDPCTVDACSDGVCTYAPLCDDGDNCTVDVCDNGICSYTSSCDDGNPCTVDLCGGGWNDDDDDDGNHGSGGCIHRPLCYDGNSCTTDECIDGVCVFTPKVCNDNNPCTTDKCVGGKCKFYIIRCDDSDPCTNDACANGVCENTPVDCDDGNPCTIDECGIWDDDDDDGNGGCRHRPFCDDGDHCTRDICDNGVCTFLPIVCDDNNPCTTDRCFYGKCKFKRIKGCSSSSKQSDFSTEEFIGGEENDVTLTAYPNPFADKLNIEFTLIEDSEVKLEIYDITGQKITTLFEGYVNASAKNSFEYIPSGKVSGVLIYRLQTEYGTYYDKAILVKQFGLNKTGANRQPRFYLTIFFSQKIRTFTQSFLLRC